MELRTIIKIFFFFVFFLYSYYLYEGIRSPIPSLGDSWDYHIPIAKMILSGEFLSPQGITIPQQYYPGSSNLFHSVFLLLHIPLTLSNLFALGVFSFVLYFLARSYTVSKEMSVLFSLTGISLTVFHRWANSVSIDVWVSIFFFITLLLLRSSLKKVWKWGVLGVSVGMLIGSKFIALLYPFPLFLVSVLPLKNAITLKKLALFLIPLFVFGVGWYVRNYLLLGNPFYPLDVLGFKGEGIFKGDEVVWRTILAYPLPVFHALISEYKLFSLWFFVFPFVYLVNRLTLSQEIKKLSFLALFLFVVFLFLPMDWKPWIMVSSLRYSYTFGVILILLLFLFVKEWKKEVTLAYFCLFNSFPVLTMSYYPKLLFFLPVGYILWLLVEHFILESKKKFTKK